MNVKTILLEYGGMGFSNTMNESCVVYMPLCTPSYLRVKHQ